MRILMVLPSLRKGGAEKLTCDIAIELQKRPGVEVRVVCFYKENAFPQLSSQLDMYWLPLKATLSLTKKNRFELDEYIKLVNSYQPHIIHSHLFEAEIISRSIDYPQAKYFSHCHDNMFQFETFHFNILTSKKKITEYYERMYLLNRYRKNGGNHFIAISNDTNTYFNRVLPSDLRNVTMIHNAINFDQYNAVNNRRDTSEIRIVNTGSFVPKKNQIFLVEIMKVLAEKGIKASLTLLGNGPEIEKVKAKAAEYGLSDKINFAGNVDSVESYLKDANLYIHSAYYEPFGLVLLEAMASGLPVISLDGKGNRDLIKDSDNGYFIEQQNAELFADKIVSLMKDRSRYDSMSRNAVEFSQKFDIKNYVDQLLELYKEDLATP